MRYGRNKNLEKIIHEIVYRKKNGWMEVVNVND